VALEDENVDALAKTRLPKKLNRTHPHASAILPTHLPPSAILTLMPRSPTRPLKSRSINSNKKSYSSASKEIRRGRMSWVYSRGPGGWRGGSLFEEVDG